jgi:membrane-bound serine protease (ClpP class)
MTDGEATMPGTAHPIAARLRAALALACLIAGMAMLLSGTASAQTTSGTVAMTQVRGVITPVVADHLHDTIEGAAADGHEALVIVLDTPGGLVTSTREIVQNLLDAPLPVIVYVAPSGADAGSAGTFITLAGHVAAMAPATTIGAATPVDGEGQEAGEKIVENLAAFAEAIAEERGRDVDFAIESVRDGRSITANAALERGAIDLIAPSLETLLTEIDGEEVQVRDSTVTLATDGALVVEVEMTGPRQLLQLLADPNLAFIFLSLGTLAILYEIANPGLGLGGVAGVVLIILAMFALSVLPVNWAGAALMLVAAAMFIAELFVPGVGVGAAGGTAALLLGGLFLFQAQSGASVSIWVLVPTAVVTFGLTVFAGIMVARSRKMRSTGGSDDMLGRLGKVEGVAEGRPRAKVGGTYWRIIPVDPSVPLRDGDEVRVTERRNIDLVVAPTARTSADDDTDDRPSTSTQPRTEDHPVTTEETT